MSDALIRQRIAGVDVPAFDRPAFAQLAEPRAATVALVTTAGLHVEGQRRLERNDEGFHVLDSADRPFVVGHASPNFDRVGATLDQNVVTPLDRLDELAESRAIGAPAPRLLAFMGAQHGTLSTIRLDSGRRAAQVLREDGVDAAVISGVCPLCTRTAGTIAHVLEEEGIATVTISLVRGITERLRPPRALHCEFPFGRPFGKPLDAPFQRGVLTAALDLLERPDGPVLEDYPDVVSIDDEPTVSCEMPPRHDPGLHPAVDEALALRPAYERRLRDGGLTFVGRAVGPESVPTAVEAFVRLTEGAAWEELKLGDDPSAVASDIRSYYEEAALTLAQGGPAGAAASRWFFEETESGALLRRAQQALRQAGATRERWFYLVPSAFQLTGP